MYMRIVENTYASDKYIVKVAVNFFTNMNAIQWWEGEILGLLQYTVLSILIS